MKSQPEQLEVSTAIIRKYFTGEEIVPVSVKLGQNVETLLSAIKVRLEAQKLTVKQRNAQLPD